MQLTIITSLYELTIKHHNLNPIEILMISWLIIASSFLAFFSYQPPRYFMILIPPMCIAASLFLNKLLTLKSIKIPKCNLYSIFYVFIWLEIVNLVVSFRIINLLMVPLSSHLQMATMRFSLIFSILTILILFTLFLFKNRISDREIPCSRKFIVVIVIVLISCSGIANGFQYLNWVKDPEYSLVNTAKEIKTIVGKDSILTGNIANTLALENNLFTITLIERKNKNNSLDFNITHLITIGGEHYSIENWKKKYPKTFDNAVLLKKFEILNNYYTGDYCYLYKIT